MAFNNSKDLVISQRRNMVSRLRLRGLSADGITLALAEEGIVNPDSGEPYTRQTVWRDIKHLDGEYRRRALIGTEQHRINQFNEIQEIKQLAWSTNDGKLALQAVKQEIELMGTKTPIRLDVTINVRVVHETWLRLKALGFDPAASFQGLVQRAEAIANVPHAGE